MKTQRKREPAPMIDFLAAQNGSIQLWWNEKINRSTVKDFEVAETPQEVAKILKEHGVGSTVMCSSSMDFASEHGFPNDGDAKALWYAGIKLAGRDPFNPFMI